jgi:hypothetical protein
MLTNVTQAPGVAQILYPIKEMCETYSMHGEYKQSIQHFYRKI